MKKVVVISPNSLPITSHINNYRWEHEYQDDNDRLEVSDGYHTMSELYEHRFALFAALVKIYDNYITPLGSRVMCAKSKLHYDGTMFDGWFIVIMVIHNMDTTSQQITYHLPMSWWDKFNIIERERMWVWDGHTSDDVIKRLLEL